MCTCAHGSDRHFLDYAGPGVCGGILSRCLEKDCGCERFSVSGSIPSNNSGISSATTIYPTQNTDLSSAGFP